MKSCDAALETLFAGTNRICKVDLYTITLIGGTVLRYTNADVDVVANGHVFQGASSPILERSHIRNARGIEVATLDVDVYARDGHVILGVPWRQAVAAGALDGAWLVLEYGFSANPGEPIVGTLGAFHGRVADTEVGAAACSLKVRSLVELLNVKVPVDLYRPGCLNTLFDTRCGVDRNSFRATGTLAGGSTQSRLLCNLTAPDDYYTLGEVLFLSGNNAGVRRSVRLYTTGAVELSFPLLRPVTAGDTFYAWPGCDGQTGTCADRYANKARYRAFPFVPVPENAI